MKLKIKKPEINFSAIKSLNPKKILNLAKKDLSQIFASPVIYITFVLFTAGVYFLLFLISKFQIVGSSDLSLFFNYLSLGLFIFVPAVTMGLVSKERQNGTLEMILSKPVGELSFLVSKLLVLVANVAVFLFLTLPFVVSMSNHVQLDFGQILTQYLGTFFVGISIGSLGILFSSIFKNEIASLLSSIFAGIVFIIMGSDYLITNTFVDTVLRNFSLLVHFQSLSRGLLDFGDLLFFVMFIFVALTLSFYSLVIIKYPSKHKRLVNLRLTTGILLVLLVLIGWGSSYLNLGLDVTANKIYTLSNTSADIVHKIQDKLTINFYSSSNLPAAFQTDYKQVENLINDFKRNSGGKIEINIKQPDKSDDVKSEAQSENVTQLNSQVTDQTSSQITVLYFGLGFQYKDKKDGFNLTSPLPTDLEYQITRKIKKVAGIDLKNIAVVSNNVQETRITGLTSLFNEINDLYNVEDITLSKDKLDIKDNTDLIIIASPIQDFDAEVLTKLKQFVDNGKSLILMADAVNLEQEGAKKNSNIKALFKDYGLTINEDLVYDNKNGAVLSNPNSRQPVTYPYWIDASVLKSETGITNNIQSTAFVWSSSIQIANVPSDIKVYKLLETSNKSNVNVTPQTADLNIGTKVDAKDDDHVVTLAAALENSKGGRVVLIGNTAFVSDNLLQTFAQYNNAAQANVSFLISSIGWSIKDAGLGEIKNKDRGGQRLNLDSTEQNALIFISIGTPIMLVAIAGIVNFAVIRNRGKRKYEEEIVVKS